MPAPSGIAAPHFNSMAPSLHGGMGMTKGSRPPRMPRMGPHLPVGGIARFDDGGTVDIGPGAGGAAPSPETENPLVQNQLQRYAGMTAEQLQELAARLGESPQGEIVRRVLAQKHQQGGDRMAAGGMPDPDQTPGAGFDLAPLPPVSLLHSAVAGRTDHLDVKTPPGSYVLPADVVSGLGEGNSMAGARILHEAHQGQGPWGVGIPRLGKGHHGVGIPKAPARATSGGIHIDPKHKGLLHENLGVPAGQPIPEKKLEGALQSDSAAVRKRAQFAENAKHFHHARGGKAGQAVRPVPILAAGGEVIVSPEAVKWWWGGGSMKRGHATLDKFVVHQRKRIIEEMKKLPGPAKD